MTDEFPVFSVGEREQDKIYYLRSCTYTDLLYGKIQIVIMFIKKICNA